MGVTRRLKIDARRGQTHTYSDIAIHRLRKRTGNDTMGQVWDTDDKPRQRSDVLSDIWSPALGLDNPRLQNIGYMGQSTA